LSNETLYGIRMTCELNLINYIVIIIFLIAYSFIALTKYIFTIPGVKSFLSEKICQDLLEELFGRHRQRGRTNENPTVEEFFKNNQALRVINSIHIDKLIENESIPKRRNNSTTAIISSLSSQESAPLKIYASFRCITNGC
jgi:hypothetical protein